MSVVNKGNVAPRDVEGTELTISVEGDSGRIVRRGSYAQLEAAKPAIGTLISTQGASMNVLSTNLRKERGELGTLTIVLGDKDRSGEGVVPLTVREETIELDYTLMEKPIESHPLFKDIFVPAGGDFSVLATIQAWENEQDVVAKGQFMYLAPNGVAGTGAYLTLSAGAQAFAAKKLAGIESYFLQVPIVRKTSILKRAVKTSKCGSRDTPPEFDDVQDVWLKTADKMTRTGAKGTWERIEEWTGFDQLDADLYP